MTNQIQYTSSFDASRYFEVSHRDYLKILKSVLKDASGAKKRTNFKKIKIDAKIAYLLSEQGFTLVAMRLMTPKAMDFKLKMIKRCNEMESLLGLGK